MKITFLGTNGWYDTATGNTPCVLIETRDDYIILDAGFGFYKVKDLVVTEKPVSLFLSHLHYDHIIGLHTLPNFKIKQGIDIYVPKVMLACLRSFLKRPFTSPPLLLPTKIRFRRASGETGTPVNFRMARLRHSVPCYGYRFNIEDRIVSYCTDTGPCRALKSLANGADLVITECAMAPGDRSLNLFHLTPEAAAFAAAEALAKRLALFHFDPGKYPSLDTRRQAETAARGIFENTLAANDGTVIEL